MPTFTEISPERRIGLPDQPVVLDVRNLQRIDPGPTVCDALFPWARDGYEEGHDWPATRR